MRINETTTPALQELAEGLGFIATAPGRYQGVPSPGALLDALAAAYTRDPGGVRLAFKVLGITPTGEASYTSENTAQPASDATQQGE